MSATGGPSKVFISYRRSESGGHAGRLYDAMAARFGDGNVFMDIEMQPGVDFVQRITEAVGACHILLVVMGPEWGRPAAAGERSRLEDPDDFVRLEVATALRRSDVTIIPLLVEDAEMPDPDELPADLRALTRRNALELSDTRWRADVARLLEVMDGLLGDAADDAPAAPLRTAGVPAPAEGPPPPAPPPPAGGLRQRAPLALAAAGVVAVIGVVVLALASAGDEAPAPRPATTGATAQSLGRPAQVPANCRDRGASDLLGDLRAARDWGCRFPDARGVTFPSLTYLEYVDPARARAAARASIDFELAHGWKPCPAATPLSSFRGTSSCLVATKEADQPAGTIEIMWHGEGWRVFGQATFDPPTPVDNAIDAWSRLV